MNTVPILPHYLSLVPLKAINWAINTKFPPDTLLEIEENPFLMTQKLGLQASNPYIAVLWNPGG